MSKLAVILGVLSALSSVNADDCTYNKVSNNTCAEACVPEKLGFCPRSLVVSKGGLSAGTCKSLGYTVDQGEKDQACGPCGTVSGLGVDFVQRNLTSFLWL
jgi:hypothetical protein